jgi:precorrin-4/cobalt-precorrin-4 C11-methyltransferase
MSSGRQFSHEFRRESMNQPLAPIQLSAAERSDPTRLAPGVYIIGAGPGDPELLTVKAQRLIAQADWVLYADSLVPKQILAGVKPGAEVVHTGNKTLEEILPRMIGAVQAGQSVVRLHSGDLSLYSALHEQIQALLAADIPVEVVPGISAFQAAAARLQVELTVPELVQTIILTRISGRTQVPEKETLASLAAHQASLCLYLSTRHVAAAQAQLLEHYPPETLVAVCNQLGWPEERIWLVPLTEIAQLTETEKLIRNTLYLISPALAAHQQPSSARSRLYHPSHSHLFRPNSQNNSQNSPTASVAPV